MGFEYFPINSSPVWDDFKLKFPAFQKLPDIFFIFIAKGNKIDVPVFVFIHQIIKGRYFGNARRAACEPKIDDAQMAF